MGVIVEAEGITVERGSKTILDSVKFHACEGELVALVGPNGAGKSTLLGVLAGDIEPDQGTVSIDGRALGEWSNRELARRRAVLPQAVTVAFPFSVRDVVEMGRAPWHGSPEATHDAEAVEEAMMATDVVDFADRRFPSLSGGERARAALARILAQQVQVILLDEPTASLDLHHQEVVLAVARKRADLGDTVVVVLHDLGLAAAYADRVVVLANGAVAADGFPEAVLAPEGLSAVYGHDIEVIRHPETGALIVVPRRTHGGIEQ